MNRRTRTLASLAAAAIALPIALPANAQSAKDFEELRNEVRRLRTELNEIKAQKAAPPATAAAAAPASIDAELTERVGAVELRQKDAVVAGDIPGSFRLPGSDTSIRLYGQAELNAVREFKGDNSANDYSTFLPYVPLNGTSARKGQTLVHARTSRLGIESTTPTSSGPLTIKLEGDFNNDPRLGNSAAGESKEAIFTQQATNSYGLRLRHAYGTFAGFTVGQTWSTFMDVDNSPETVDFNGPIGSTSMRQGLIRYTSSTQGMGNWTVALENPVSYAYDVTGTTVKDGLSTVPDVVLRWDKGFDWGAASVRAVTQQIKVVNDTVNASERGYGLAATAALKLRGGQDTLSLAATYGDGIGRYFNYVEGAFIDEVRNRMLTERVGGLVVGYQYKRSDTLRFNFVGGWQKNFDNAYTDFALANGLGSGQYGINRSLYQLHAGLIYNPVKNVDVGLEYIFGQRKTLVGEKGDLSRLNLMARYVFN
jgi:hypothetical protein